MHAGATVEHVQGEAELAGLVPEQREPGLAAGTGLLAPPRLLLSLLRVQLAGLDPPLVGVHGVGGADAELGGEEGREEVDGESNVWIIYTPKKTPQV